MEHLAFRHQLEIMQQQNTKAEIQAIGSPTEYIISKIAQGQWI